MLDKSQRIDYSSKLTFEEPDCPFELFSSWFDFALEEKVPEPEAMALSSISADNFPDLRIVLLKGFSKLGFRFFTNLNSAKAKQIANNSSVAACFFWAKLHRQVRIRGEASLLPRDEVEEYFSTRPLGAQLGAIVSKQSSVLDSHTKLCSEHEELLKSIKQEQIKAPESWGGYLIKPVYFEYWQGERSRLHKRLCYNLGEDKNWERAWLYP